MYTFIETRLFTRLVGDYLADEAYGELQLELVRNPDAGAVIRGSGGIRKIRWAALGRGKRGSYRVIYFVRKPQAVIWMLTIYPKNMTEKIPIGTLREIRKEIEDE